MGGVAGGGVALCTEGCLAVSLVSTQWMLVDPLPHWDNPKSPDMAKYPLWGQNDSR